MLAIEERRKKRKKKRLLYYDCDRPLARGMKKKPSCTRRGERKFFAFDVKGGPDMVATPTTKERGGGEKKRN